MGKLKRLSMEIISLLCLEPLTFNQIVKEITNEKEEDIINMLDILIEDGIVNKKGSKYGITSKTSSIFAC